MHISSLIFFKYGGCFKKIIQNLGSGDSYDIDEEFRIRCKLTDYNGALTKLSKLFFGWIWKIFFMH